MFQLSIGRVLDVATEALTWSDKMCGDIEKYML